MRSMDISNLLGKLKDSLSFEDGKVRVVDLERLQEKVHILAETSALEKGLVQGMSRYLTRLVSLECGVYPASIQDLYVARGGGKIPLNFTVPAMNLRSLSYDAARAVFRAAGKMNAAAIIFEIARSEIGYSDQRPSEYATNVLLAAIKEGYKGPVFIQGDHFQISAKKYASDPEFEVNTVRDLIIEAINAGFYNIDIDTSTLVDLGKSAISEQQSLNTELSAVLTAFIRSNEPDGVTISVGGEIGEVGGKNSTEEELRAYLDGYLDKLSTIDQKAKGISKISIQTGTSHGGVVMPDGSIAQVKVDFETLRHLSRVARNVYGLAGAVQHGASTLPEDAFGKFVEYEACEVHLATNFQNMLFDHIPDELRKDMYAYLDEKYASERREGVTNEQFYYKTRKNALGPYKASLWKLPKENREEIMDLWGDQFTKLFNLLGVANTRKYVDKTVKPVLIIPDIKDYLGDKFIIEDVKDLAD